MPSKKKQVGGKPGKQRSRRYCPKALREPLTRFREMAQSLKEYAGQLEEMQEHKQALVMRGQAGGLMLAADMYLDWADDQRAS